MQGIAQSSSSSEEGFVFDIDGCRQTFEHFDRDKSGFLEVNEVLKLAENIWDTFYPDGPKLDQASKAALTVEIIRQSDTNHDGKISFDEFVPWYRGTALKYWRLKKVKEESSQSNRFSASTAHATNLRRPFMAEEDGFSFDVEECRRAFEHFDRDRSGYLEVHEILMLAESLWTAFYPNEPTLDQTSKAALISDIIRTSDHDHDGRISFNEFMPWYRSMALKYWNKKRQTTGQPVPAFSLNKSNPVQTRPADSQGTDASAKIMHLKNSETHSEQSFNAHHQWPGFQPKLSEASRLKKEIPEEDEFKFDFKICKQTFEHFDKDNSGHLEVQEVVQLAETLWDTFFPDGPKLDHASKAALTLDIIGQSDVNQDGRLSFEEFVPWYKSMAAKYFSSMKSQKARPAHASKPSLTQEPIASGNGRHQHNDTTLPLRQADRARPTTNGAPTMDTIPHGGVHPRGIRLPEEPFSQIDPTSATKKAEEVQGTRFSKHDQVQDAHRRANGLNGNALEGDENLKDTITELRISVLNLEKELDENIDSCMELISSYKARLGIRQTSSGA